MRVLMLSKACLVGIYQRKLEEIAQLPAISALKVLVPPHWQDERGTMHLERAHTRGYSLQTTPIRFNGSFHLHHYPRLAAEASAFMPDILHIDEEPYNLATWQALRIARRLGAKTLFFSWQNIQRRYPPPFSWGERWVLGAVDYALMGTESAAAVWRAKGYRGRWAVIPQFGVDPALFTPKLFQESTLRVGYVGRLVQEKGVDLLLTALARLVQHPWRLMIVGGGPEETALQTQAARLGITERITWAGQVPSVQMPAIFQQLDALVIPSRTLPNWKEQFGRVIIEAMASEVPVIGSDSGAIPDVIGTAGLIFREDDADDLHHQLERLLKEPALRLELGKKGRQRVLDHFTQEQIAAQTVQVYQEMMRK